MAIPMTIAQLVQVIYNIVDRIYIGHLPDASSLALTGLGITFPVITLIAAFTNLFGNGGAPLCSIERGKGDEKRAERIMGVTFLCLLCVSLLAMAIGYGFMKPLLYLFGASDDSYGYAADYLRIYLLGTPFVMAGTGMNGFINSQGFGKIGMVTVVAGAVFNIILDPLFIFVLDMGIKGAAIATVISQFISAVWVIAFLNGRKTILKIKKTNMVFDGRIIKEVVGLGLSGFFVEATNGAVQIACNSTLKIFGGDIYVGIMTAVNSVRDLFTLPVRGITSGAQPVIGFNYGAKKADRVKSGIKFMVIISAVYTLVAWIVVLSIPEMLIGIFNSEAALVELGTPALKIYFFGFIFMALQFSGQSTFVALGQSKHAIFFSLLRKIVIVVPFTLLLPRIGFGVDGVFMAEPISNIVGGIACFTTMCFTVKRLLGRWQQKD
ncbi:MAG: MATE family efflux transporter [Lachnospiraceae bacterium]